MNVALFATAAFALLDWFAVARQSKTLQYLFKPATMLGVILVAWFITQAPHDARQAQWFLVGFFLSLLGDIFLMLPDPRWFVPGLGAFLLAHIGYIIGLNPTLPPLTAFLLLLPCALVIGVIVSRVIAGLRAANHTLLVFPVVLYGIAMTFMLFSAWATLLRPEWTNPRRAYVIIGATLFFVSDSLLAWNRFVKPLRAAPLAIIITYHAGQLALALSIHL